MGRSGYVSGGSVMEEENVSARGRVVHFRENKDDAKAKCGCINVNGLTFSLKWDKVSCKRCLKLRPAMWDLSPNDRGWPTRDYFGICCKCEKQFSGYKRQIVCRSCEEYDLKEEVEHLKIHRDVAVSELDKERRKTNGIHEEHRLIVEQKQRDVDHYVKVINRLRKALISTGMSPELVDVFLEE
jgi:hypothetical protein